MTQVEIDARRHALAAEYLALDDFRSERGLEIAHEFGVLAEEEDHLQRKGPTRGWSTAANRLVASSKSRYRAPHEGK